MKLPLPDVWLSVTHWDDFKDRNKRWNWGRHFLVTVPAVMLRLINLCVCVCPL